LARKGRNLFETKLGAKMGGAEVRATSASTSDHVDRPPINLSGETCHLSASYGGAELRIHFLKYFRWGVSLKIFRKEKAKKKLV
jgi:hypothetical protein